MAPAPRLFDGEVWEQLINLDRIQNHLGDRYPSGCVWECFQGGLTKKRRSTLTVGNPTPSAEVPD